MKILVLGAGRMGHGAVFDLIHNSPGVERVTVADFDFAKAEAVAASVGTDRVDARQIDASNYAEIVELIACGVHLTLFTTGRGSVVGSAISPVIKICANPETFRKLSADMDIDAGRIMEGRGTLDEVGAEIHDRVLAVAGGQRTVSEALGHQEFILTYKAFDPIGPACLPLRRTT